ncbi:MAG: hypothetical protein J6M34_06030 [Clostridia bacterium]|nr:hypothetical protein [Clostridia bacterium]
MKKIDRAVWKETVYVALWTLILSALMQAVFLILGKWGLSVLLGNFWGAAGAVLNFFLLGIGVQHAVSQNDPKKAQTVIRLSHTLRLLMLVVFAAVGVLVPVFQTVAAVVPLIFPQVAMLFRPKFGGIDENKEGGA